MSIVEFADVFDHCRNSCVKAIINIFISKVIRYLNLLNKNNIVERA